MLAGSRILLWNWSGSQLAAGLYGVLANKRGALHWFTVAKSHLGELPPPHPCLWMVFQHLNVRVKGVEHSFWGKLSLPNETGLTFYLLSLSILKFQYWPLKNSFDHRKFSILYQLWFGMCMGAWEEEPCKCLASLGYHRYKMGSWKFDNSKADSLCSLGSLCRANWAVSVLCCHQPHSECDHTSWPF